jgi:3D (Asp-Asp-Asp) domain-containing protein
MTALVAAAAVALSSTSYCLNGTMADGTRTRHWSAAHNGLPLGTRVWIDPAVRGRHRWTVRDRIGWGTELDLWAPSCGQAVAYGRRVVRLRVGWPRLRFSHGRGRVVGWSW